MNSAAIRNTAIPSSSAGRLKMDWEMVRRMILKDWYLQRMAIFACIGGGVASLATIAYGGKAGFTLGVILLVTVLVASAAVLVTNTMVLERREHTLPFLMSLPISYREYTAAKILGMMLIFLIPWLTLTGGSLMLIALAPQIRGFAPFAAIMAVEILVNTCGIAAVAIVTESQGWTIAAIMGGNLALNGIGYLVAHIPGIANTMFTSEARWTPVAWELLLAEFGAIGLLLGGAFLVQSRKRDFL